MEEQEQEADCMCCDGRFSEDHSGGSGYDARNISDWRTNFVLVRRTILLVNLVWEKHCFILNLYHLYL
jgi:hypothetical protein